LTHKNNTLS